MYIELKRTSVALRGRDRATFLHNFCTQDAKRASADEPHEAFVLDQRGKLLGHIVFLVGPDFIEVNTVDDQASALIGHWDRYLIREDVQFSDQSNQRRHWFAFDPDGDPPRRDVGSLQTHGPRLRWTFENGQYGWEAEADFAGPGVMISAPQEWAPEMVGQFQSRGWQAADWQQLTAHRIAYRTPWFGVDSSHDNLPQELRRNNVAVSFQKGCYLGQETVARLDALGQVNWLLARLRLSGEHPSPPGAPISSSTGQQVGRLTSVAWSDKLQGYIALGMLRRTVVNPGTMVVCLDAPAIVEDDSFPSLPDARG
ncbi:MAG TPA: glycine cleavage T C-terminal barrel domain-containing protein [Pirellulaceae bacterium]|nr:glycine cleavage T C-terminal barrel domain-containing protein [Pirellulaceae bacterium]